LSRLDIEEEIKKHFPAIAKDGKFFDALVRIGWFFTSAGDVMPELDKLEQTLFTRAFGKSLGPERDKIYRQRAKTYYGKATERAKAKTEGRSVEKDADLQHLVTLEFADGEKSAGLAKWKNNGEPHQVMVMGPFSGQGFLRNLQLGRHWKDIVNPNHGEYTHRLQWYLIGKGAGLSGVGDIFRKIGSAEVAEYAPYPGAPKEAYLMYTVWDAIVDRLPTTDERAASFPFVAQNSLDFRCPENFLTWLCGQEDRYPILTSFLRGRKEKRLAQNLDFSEYVALKVYGEPFNKLSQNLQESITEFVQSGTAVKDPKGLKLEYGLLAPKDGGYSIKQLPKVPGQ
jgi:Family of unknown function (DUF5636)